MSTEKDGFITLSLDQRCRYCGNKTTSISDICYNCAQDQTHIILSEPDKDMVNNPPHYGGPCECIDAIKYALTPEEYRGYLKGAAFKYLWRHKYKGKPLEDISKATWYLNKLEEDKSNG